MFSRRFATNRGGVVLNMESGKVVNPLAERLVEEKLPSMVKY